ncbi:DUF2752 domain-containing protein [Planomonospora corallina]|uniref:DUF2752 domain-containing protein n=1 Tax=Planomonospora corallina TaxID=1806052 RepID=A0ABV8I9Q9_9ACTN
MTGTAAGARGPGRRGWRALPAPLGAAAAVAAGAAFVGAVDPNEPGRYPACPFLTLTGLYCPGCGGLRAVHALTRGDLAAAFDLNPVLVPLAAALVLLWACWTVAAWRGTAFPVKITRPGYAWAFLVLMVTFWIGRNLPIGEFLAP